MTTLTNAMKSPPAIGGTTPAAGYFTELQASSSVSGTGFSTLFASPYVIGSGTPAAGTFSVLAVTQYFSGALYGYGNASPLLLDADGKLSVEPNTNNGCVIYGRGAANDVAIFNRDASVYLYWSTSSITIQATDFVPKTDNTTSFGSASKRYKDGFFSGQVKGGAGTGTGAPVMIGTLSVNTTVVGNVGAGTDDLMTYTLPANSLSANGNGVRVTAWGTVANNANAKTLTVNFGTAVMATDSMTISGALNWMVIAHIFRTGSNTQTYIAKIESSANGLSVRDFDIESGNATESDSGTITIKCTGAATSDNDIVQKGMLVEFIN